MSKPIRFALIGTGVGGTFVARAVKFLKDEGVAELVSVTSRREERARKFAEEWGLRSWYTNHLEMFRKENIDAVIISTPHYLHFPETIDALDAGYHVLVDKPMAIDLRQCDEMIRRAKKNGLKLGVLLQNRFDEKVLKIKRLVEEGKLGKLILGEANVKWFRTHEYYENSSWRGRWATEGGGSLINQAIHYIDLLIWIMGSPSSLYAHAGAYTHNIEVDDLAVALLKFKNGALGVIQSSTSIYPGLPTRLEIHGDNGTAIIEGEAIKMIAIKGEEIQTTEKKEGLASWSRPEAVPPTNHIALIRDFATAIIEDREPKVPGEEGRRSIEVIRAIYYSSKNKSIVNFPLIDV
ncbi:MAG: Gfo/Idh/MocA family oxidoreductase [Thermoproteales archaeon]|nr:Gfo/Idh/MocA family oxidoreductase [Thermoproteales archaeon]